MVLHMKFQTHIVGGVVLGVLCSYSLDYPIASTVIYYGGVIAGSLLPDIDHPKSFIGKKIRPVSKSFHKLFGHRTFTHSLFTVIIFLEIIRITQYDPLLIGLTLGIISHILLDLLTPQGVALFYPVSKKRHKLILK